MSRQKRKRHILLKWPLLALNFMAALGLLLSFSASIVDPIQFWIISLFGLALPYLLLANLIFIIGWLALKRWYFLISIAAILSGWPVINRYVASNNTNTDLDTVQGFSVMSYNVHNFHDPEGLKPYEVSRKRIFEFLARQRSDIICLQEFKSPRRPGKMLYDTLKKAVNMPFLVSAPYRSGQQHETDALVILSKYPVVNTFVIRNEPARNFALAADIKIGEDTIRVFNAHLESYRFGFDDYDFLTQMDLGTGNEEIRDGSRKVLRKLRAANMKRSAEVRQLRSYLEASGYPVLLCGDFNDTPSSFTYAFIARMMIDTFLESGKGFGNTYAGRLPSFRIDYIFHDGSFESYNFATFRVPYSDHYPVSCYLRLNWP